MTTSAPIHMTGHLAPVPDEIDAVHLPVDGALPPELTGRYLRNGPNPLPGEPSGTGSPGTAWCTASASATAGPSGTATAGCARRRWQGESMIGPDGTVDRSVGVANTHVIAHAGRIMALVESSFPHELTPELDTVGPCDFGGRLTTAMTAHPKTDPSRASCTSSATGSPRRSSPTTGSRRRASSSPARRSPCPARR